MRTFTFGDMQDQIPMQQETISSNDLEKPLLSGMDTNLQFSSESMFNIPMKQQLNPGTPVQARGDVPAEEENKEGEARPNTETAEKIRKKLKNVKEMVAKQMKKSECSQSNYWNEFQRKIQNPEEMSSLTIVRIDLIAVILQTAQKRGWVSRYDPTNWVGVLGALLKKHDPALAEGSSSRYLKRIIHNLPRPNYVNVLYSLNKTAIEMMLNEQIDQQCYTLITQAVEMLAKVQAAEERLQQVENHHINNNMVQQVNIRRPGRNEGQAGPFSMAQGGSFPQPLRASHSPGSDVNNSTECRDCLSKCCKATGDCVVKCCKGTGDCVGECCTGFCTGCGKVLGCLCSEECGDALGWLFCCWILFGGDA